MSDLGRVSADGATGFGSGESRTGLFGTRSTSAPLSLFGLLLAFIVLLMSDATFENYFNKGAIQRHGDRQDVEVVQIYTRVHHGYRMDTCSVYGDLLFIPRGWDHPIKLKIYLSGCEQSSRAVSYAIQKHELPIAYDTTNPRLALVNFDDEVFREDTAKTLKARLLSVICFAAVFVFIITLLSMLKKRPRIS